MEELYRLLSSNSWLELIYLSFREKTWVNIFVTLVEAWESFITGLELGRWNIITSSPDLDLLFAVLFDSLNLIETLESSIVALIEPPVLDDRKVVTIDLISCIVEGLNSSCEHGCVDNIELVPILLEGLACVDGFLDA